MNKWKMISLILLSTTLCPVQGLQAKSSTENLKMEVAQRRKIKGVVKDTQGPLIGATVLIKGTTKGTVTNLDGEFILDVQLGDIIQISYVSYLTKEIKYTNQSSLKVLLKEDLQTLNELVVIGYGTQKKVNLTGSVSVVKADQLAERPVQNVAQALQGVVPGLNLTVSKTGGALNSKLDMNIRGSGSIGEGSNSSPLILIDGMEGDMNTLNPQDIESISVMKDAASATIYGSRAPFGVILITTKKGREGKAVVNYNNNFRYSTPIKPDMLDSWSWANYFNDAASNAGEGLPYSDDMMDKIQAYQRGELSTETESTDGKWYGSYGGSWANNDWFDIFYKNLVASQEHNATVSGGSKKVQYHVSANYLQQDGIMNIAPDTYERLSFSAKINVELAPWAHFGVTTRFIRTEYDRPEALSGQTYHEVYKQWPTSPWKLPELDGYNLDRPNYAGWTPALIEGGRNRTQTEALYQQASLTIEPLKNWTITGELNFRAENNFIDSESLDTYTQHADGVVRKNGNAPSMVYGEGNKTNFLNPNIYTNYELNLGSGHSFKTTIGFQSEINKYRQLSAKGSNLITPSTPTLNNTAILPSIGGTYSDWATMGVFGRLGYNYQEKYLAEVSVRYDGTSRFLDDQRWNIFPSFSMGWNIKNEDFLKDVANIDVIKPRFSWGQLGNQNTQSLYPFYQSLDVKKDYNSWLINGAKPGVYVNGAPGLVSSLLTWETVESWNVGVDFGFLKHRLSSSVEFFNRKTLNMVGPAPALPDVLGIGVPKMNNSDLESKGWEIEIAWRDMVESIGLTYGVRANLSDSRQYITRYPNETMAINNWYDGKEFGAIWGYTTVGMAQTQAEMDAHLANVKQDFGSNWGAGDIMYADLNKDGIISKGGGTLGDTGDQTIIGNSTPRYNYGIVGDVAWKGFDFSIFIQGVGKRDLALGGNVFWGMTGGMWGSTGLEQHLDSWRPADTESIFGPNTNAYYPKAYMSGEAGKNQETQTRYLQNGAYARIKNIQLGYTLPVSISKKIALNNIRVFFSADNVATFTSLAEQFDPETTTGETWGDGKTYPLSKVFSFGINVTL